ncbi:ATP-binding cassette domain-containing protein [Streptomyces sp. NPDC087263]|uniref:branched-chain amino acid ABC transporter permease/ATP-binding protein n=1 Tax=Streptomyces sp. NPDC087263 TaxID=3365773 RepID=UPI00380DAC4A
MASLTYDLTLAGLSVGSAAALTGVGLIVTHRATGVLNFAHGAIAMACAYLLRQFTVEWGWPLGLASAVTLLVVAPAIGVALERFVFRPLSVLGGDPAQTLVASIGVFVLLVGGAALVWGTGARADAPTPVSADPWGQLAVAVALAVGVGAVTRWTRIGTELRAVVDDRSLAVLGGIDADRVAAAGWAFGSFTAGLTGVLLAPYVRLDPYGMPLLVMEVLAVAVVARMRSLPVAVVVALGIGVAQSQLTRLHPSGWEEPLLQAVGANLFVVALLIAALVLPGIGTRDALPRTATARVATPPGAWIVAVVLFLLPLGFAGSDLHTSVQVPALGVVLLSLVVVTGRGGQISLGQAAYAGLGALFTALLAAGRFPGLPQLPELAALAVAVILVAPLGLLTGWPAISRHGLALALATFAVGVGVSRFVFAQPYATSGLSLGRPAGFDGDRAYYLLELALLGCALVAAGALRRGRTGRALAAMRDHESGASAAGVRVPALKLTAFVAGAALAALGGGMLGMGLRAFDATAYDPVRGLLWFAAVVVLGADSVLGALAAAALLVGLDAGARGGVAAALIGVLAVLVGRFPGGPYEALHTAASRLHLRRRATLTPLGTRVRRQLRPVRPRMTRGPLPAGAAPMAAARPGRRLPAVPAVGERRRSSSPTDSDRSLTTGPRHTEQRPPETPDRHGRQNTLPEPGHPPDTTPGRAATPLAGTEPPSTAERHAADEKAPNAEHPRSPAHPPQHAPTNPGQPPRTTPTPAGTAPPGTTGQRGTGAQAPNTEHSGGAAHPPQHSPADPGRPPDTTPTPTDTPSVEPPPVSTTTPDAEHPGSTAQPRGAAAVSEPAERPSRPVYGTPSRSHSSAQDPGRPRSRLGSGRAAASRSADRGADRAVPRRSRLPLEPTATQALRARRLHVTYGGFTALDGVDLDVRPGQVTAVVGPNGAGKSTLFHCLAGTLRPAGGKVLLGERDITRLAAHARTRLGIARTFQQLAIFPSLTVAENVRVGAEQGRSADPGSVERALRLFGLEGPVRALPAAGLPTGTLRRVELARALAGGPRVLLLDEPAAGLDSGEVTALARVLRALAADGMALLVVEHDLDLVADLAHTVHVMAAGRIVTSGPAGLVLDTGYGG